MVIGLNDTVSMASLTIVHERQEQSVEAKSVRREIMLIAHLVDV